MSRGLKLALAAAVAVKAAVVLTIVAGHATVPFSEPGYWSNFSYPFDEEPTLRSAFKTWDGNHYLYLADRWYGPKHISNAFYPLLPALMRAAAPLAGGDALLAGLAVSLACAVAAVGYLFALTRAWRDEETALRACLLALAFPTAFYFGLLYSEAPFLLLTVALFFHLRRGDLVPSLVCAAALPLTRPTGLLVLLPALVTVFTAEPGLRPTARKLLVPLAFAAGFAAYLGVLYAATGDPLAGFEAQRVFLAQNALGNLLHPLDWFVANFVSVAWTLNGFTTSAVNRLAFVLFVGALAACWRCLPRDLLAYTLVLGLVPAMSGLMTSYVRYVAVAFPLFMCAAARLRGWRLAAVLAPSFALQAVALLAHASNRWVA